MPMEDTTLPLFTETVSVGIKKTENSRVRMTITPEQHQERIPITLADEQVTVERIPIGQFVDTAPDIRVEGDTTVIPVLEERAVVTVRLFLREEVHLRRIRTTHDETHDITLRRETATVTRVPINQGEPVHE